MVAVGIACVSGRTALDRSKQAVSWQYTATALQQEAAADAERGEAIGANNMVIDWPESL